MKLGYTLLYVDDVEATMKFYENAFGLTPGFLHESNQYGEMETGSTKLGFVAHETAESHGFTYQRPSQMKSPAPFEIAFVTDDVSAAFQRAVRAGATSLAVPMQKPWGQTVSYVSDCNGVLIEICSPMGA